MQVSVVFSDYPEAEHKLIPCRTLGQGKFPVYHVKANTSSTFNNDFAMKVFPKEKDKSPNKYFIKEKVFLSKLSHPHIITYIPIFKHNSSHDLILTEFTPNGDYFDFVSKGGLCNNEKIIRTYFHHLIEGIEYLHSQGVAHLDLKLENLLLDKDFSLKILDFDQAQSTQDTHLTSGGTPGYRAPEVIYGRCNNLKKADMYAVGIVLYASMTGNMPFLEQGENVPKTATYKMFREQNAEFWQAKRREVGIPFDQDLINLFNGLWEENTQRRFGVEQVKRSKWYNRGIFTKQELKSMVAKILSQKVS